MLLAQRSPGDSDTSIHGACSAFDVVGGFLRRFVRTPLSLRDEHERCCRCPAGRAQIFRASVGHPTTDLSDSGLDRLAAKPGQSRRAVDKLDHETSGRQTAAALANLAPEGELLSDGLCEADSGERVGPIRRVESDPPAARGAGNRVLVVSAVGRSISTRGWSRDRTMILTSLCG